MKQARKIWFAAAGLLAVLIVACLVYLPSLKGGWVFDDFPHVANNEAVHIKNISVAEIRQAALQSPQPGRALANVSFALVYYFCGEGSGTQHTANLAFHLLATVFAFLLFFEILRRPVFQKTVTSPAAVALFGAAVFALHPLNTQSVSYIVQRMNLLAALFVMAALYCRMRASVMEGRKIPGKFLRPFLYVLFVLSAVAGVLCKENAVSIVLLLPVVDLMTSGEKAGTWLRMRWKVLALCLFAGLAAALLYLVLGVSFMGGYENRDFTMMERLLTQHRVVLWYITLWIFPAGSRLSLEHNISVSSGLFSPPQTVLAVLAIAIATLAALYHVRRAPLVCGGWLWFVAGLVMESSVLPLELAFEHRMYLPGIGLYLAAAGLFYRLGIKKAAVPLLLIVLASLALLTHERNRVWQNSGRLWKDALHKAPQKARPFANLCSEAYGKGEFARARRLCRAALARAPGHEKALYNLGLACKSLGRLDEAESAMERAAQEVGDEGLVHYQLGLIRYKKGEYKDALISFKEAVRLMPGDGLSYYRLGQTYEKLNSYNMALAAYEKAEAKANDIDAMLKNNISSARKRTADKIKSEAMDR